LRKDDFVSSQDFLVIKYLEEKNAEIKCPEKGGSILYFHFIMNAMIKAMVEDDS